MKYHTPIQINLNVFVSLYLAYIIKWNFQIFRTGIRHLKGGKSRQDDVGKDRVVFFFWQGNDCSASDKGTAALMTVEMDTEEGPQVIFHLIQI